MLGNLVQQDQWEDQVKGIIWIEKGLMSLVTH